jgi:hypothetical protein
METNKAVQNQKVFVELRAVLNLQSWLEKRQRECREETDGSQRLKMEYFAQGIESAIETLGLPIPTPLKNTTDLMKWGR